MHLIARIVTLLLSPFDMFSRAWEKKDLGVRLARVLVDIFLLVHLVATFLPPPR